MRERSFPGSRVLTLPAPFAPGEPPVDRAVREAGLALALESGDFDAAGQAARSLLEALHRAAENGENAVALLLLLSRRVCDDLCNGGSDAEETAGGLN